MNLVFVDLEKNTKNAVVLYRKNKFLTIGRNKGFVAKLDDITTLSMKKNKINVFLTNFFDHKINLGISLGAIFLLGYLLFFL